MALALITCAAPGFAASRLAVRPVLRATASSGAALLAGPAAPGRAAAVRASAAAASLVVPGLHLADASAVGEALTAWPRDASMTIFLACASVVWIKGCNYLATSGAISAALSRKLVHMGSGPLFVLFWPLFSTTASAQFAAIAVPCISIIRLLLAGLGADDADSSDLVSAISRSGDQKEALGGPMLYTVVLLLCTLFGWRSIVSVVAVCQMGIGDGMADIVGRRYGSVKWPMPFAAKKSLIGSAAFAFFGFVASIGMVSFYHALGFSKLSAAAALAPVAIISLACAFVELLPIGDDNLTVPAAAAVTGTLLLR